MVAVSALSRNRGNWRPFGGKPSKAVSGNVNKGLKGFHSMEGGLQGKTSS
jgi:hypothetical protein